MTHQQKLQSVREKIIKIIPGVIKSGFGYQINFKDFRIKKVLGRPITLEDVLITFTDIRLQTLEIGSPSGIPKTGSAFVLLRMYNKKEIGQWQLGKSLDEQSEEVLEFLDNNL